MEKRYGRREYVEITRFMSPGRDDHVRAIERCENDDAAREQMLTRLEADRKIVQFDSKAPLESVLRRLRSLFMYPTEMNLRWTKALSARFETYGSIDGVEALLEYIGERSLTVGTALVSIDTQNDWYALAFVSERSSHALTAIAPGYIGTLRSGSESSERSSVAHGPLVARESGFANPESTPGVSWMAVYLLGADPHAILCDLGLTDTGIAYAPGISTLACAILPGWVVVVDHHAEGLGYVGNAELLQRLSCRGTYVVACFRSADQRTSSAVQYFGGNRYWATHYDPDRSEGGNHLDYWGNLYWDFAKIRAAGWKKHKKSPDQGHLYRVPLAAAHEWTGFVDTTPLTEARRN
ncbi:hypothetical protein [Nocardia sp. NPDC057668]|uniref:DUF6630 family protein n=1 Tax=Nocardia sp. NPDC057668 TaxID=3346202 RepID=UPI00366CE099